MAGQEPITPIEPIDVSRVILHSDMNSFYASVEQAENPNLRGLPVVVGGNEETRHGIVLAASIQAKRAGVRTAQALWEARRACPEAIIVPPHYELYHYYSHLARSIYYDYTDLVEPFGPDECWLDVTHSLQLSGGEVLLVAREISERVRQELGLSVSVGVSWNKIFAKFGSDHDKPDGLMVVTPQNATSLVWPAPSQDLLYVGPATSRKLARLGIATIGQLAQAPPELIRQRLGKMGLVVQAFAQGRDASPVRPLDEATRDILREVKSVGNGVTCPFDVDEARLARQVTWLLGESVCQRLRALGLAARTVQVSGRSPQTLVSRSRQTTLARPTNLTGEFCQTAAALVCAEWDFAHGEALRGLGVRAANLVPAGGPVQLDLEGTELARIRAGRLDACVDELRSRFGNHAVRRLSELADPRLSTLDPERDHTTHPVSFFA